MQKNDAGQPRFHAFHRSCTVTTLPVGPSICGHPMCCKSTKLQALIAKLGIDASSHLQISEAPPPTKRQRRVCQPDPQARVELTIVRANMDIGRVWPPPRRACLHHANQQRSEPLRCRRPKKLRRYRSWRCADVHWLNRRCRHRSFNHPILALGTKQALQRRRAPGAHETTMDIV